MKKQYQAVTAEEAVKVIKSCDHVHISSVSNVPQCLVKALCERGRAGELKNVYIHHLHTEGAAPYVNPEFEGIFQHNAFFVGANVRESVQKGLADYIPVFLGETTRLYREHYIKCNVAMIQVCPPDKFGYVSLRPSGAVTTRNHIHWFITEYGAVNLYGRSLQERAKLIISVAHPQFQEELEEAAFKRFGSHYHYICKNSVI